jgi:uncharacterized protein (TIGR03435 family)
MNVRGTTKSSLFMATTMAAVILPALGQAPAASTGVEPPALKFDVVSIKLNTSGSPLRINFPPDGDGISTTDINLTTFFLMAYSPLPLDLHSTLPDWANSEHYDIQAKVTEQDVAAYHKLTEAQRKQMLQAILAENFHMKSHYETREIPAYALVVAKGGPKMKEVVPGTAHPDAPKGRDGNPTQGQMLYSSGVGELTAQETSMATFVTAISPPSMAGRPVVDKTGLAGVYDFKLKWTPEQNRVRASSENEATDPGTSFFTAVQEQMGLRLESQKLPLPFLVIDSIERPASQ